VENNSGFHYYSGDYEDPYNCVESYGINDTRLIRKKQGFEGFEVLEHFELKDIPDDGLKRYLDTSRKIVIDNGACYGHFMTSWLYVLVRSIEHGQPLTVLFAQRPGGIELLLNHTSSVTEYLHEELTRRGHRVEYIEGDALYLNNFIHIKSPFGIQHERLKPVSDFLVENLSPSVIPASEKIYLSRGKVTTYNGNTLNYIPTDVGSDPDKLQSHREENQYGFSDRLDDEKKLEEYLKDLGFIILCPEDFTSYRDQLDRIASARILMSVTSSALNACLVLAPNTFVVELGTMLNTRMRPNGDVDIRFSEFHDHYKVQSSIRNNLHMFISNKNCKVADILNSIESNSSLKAFLSS